jgi:uncharacterized RDD family membrane protein YckC
VTFDDRQRIITPEGVTLELGLSGVGSRMLAALVDLVIWYLILFGLVGIGTASNSEAVFVVLVSFGGALLFIYHIVFEVLNAGRTLGKLAAGIRVVDSQGGPVRLGASFVRNLMRVVDGLPGFYLVGLIAILASARSQRLGDMVADTLVVYDPRRPRRSGSPVRPLLADATMPMPPGNADRLNTDDLNLVRDFLDRRYSLEWKRRTELARRLYEQLAAKAGVHLDPATDPEAFLEALVFPSEHADTPAAWDVSAIDANDMAVLQGFLERRHSLEWGARVALARTLMERLVPRVSAPLNTSLMAPEDFLERLYLAKTGSRP